MIVKQADVRANLKMYFDIAFEGEPVIVPRKEAKNVVIISEGEYNRLKNEKTVLAYAERLAPILSPKKKVQANVGGNVREHNEEKLRIISSLKDGWNGNGAPAFSEALIEKTEELLNNLTIQPEIFPTALGTIQMEYDNQRRDHMEIEIGMSDTAEIFIVNFDGEVISESIPATADALNGRIGAFYG